MMTSQILKFVDFAKTQKSGYLKNETLFFSSNKKIHWLHIKSRFTAKNSFIAEVTPESGIADHYFIMEFF